MTSRYETTDSPDPEDLAFLGNRLAEFNDADVGASARRPLAVFVRDEAGSIVAGISAYTAWGWLYVQWLWVDATQRGHGTAGRMLASAETEAIGRGCHGAMIDTFNPIALKVYRGAGYEPFGELKDFPTGRSRIFLQKQLAPSGSAGKSSAG